jgi:hypothetical protein
MDGRCRLNSRLNASGRVWLHAYGRQSMTTKSDELADQIMELIHGAEVNDALEALADATAFKWSTIVCPGCRKAAARAFIKAIPNMLHHANKLAADYAAHAGAEPATQQHTCH